jgi:glycosyltransferase involved in cell wall biosynthesis
MTQLAVITSGFPRLSETFALHELLALHRAGVLHRIFATKPGDGHAPHPGVEDLAGKVELLPPGTPSEQAAVVASRLGGSPVEGIHAYFAHTPCAVASEAAGALELPFSFSAHARDVRKVTRWELADRARRAACVVACNPDVAAEFDGFGASLRLIPHGVDLSRFTPAPLPDPVPLRLLAVGRFVDKKGFEVLIDALAGLNASWTLCVVGDGRGRERLERAVAAHGLADKVSFIGHLTHEALPRAYAAAHAVVVPSITDASGDRDGLPNVVLEAMASARAVIASEIAAIPSAVGPNETGILVPPGDALALRGALHRIAADHALRRRLGLAGRALVERRFALTSCTARLLRCLEAGYA